MIQESGQENQFGYLLEMYSNPLCQLGVLTSDSFSERMTSASNVLVDTYWLHLHDEMTDKMILLCVSKRFMEIVRTKKYFSSEIFSSILSDESPKV